MNEILDYVIIGAGPAGLAFGKTLVENNKNSFVVFEMGKNILDRDRYALIESITGTGGAGLFSDGKFSFYPSGTQVYKLPDIYQAYLTMLQDITLYIDTAPNYPNMDYNEDTQNDNWFLKSYPSMYMSLDNRINLINALKNKIGNKLFNNHKVLSWCLVNNLYEIQVLDLINNKTIMVLSKNIICAGGRFQPIDLPVKKIFKRFEFGVRIQGSIDNSAFNSSINENLDPKYKYSVDENTEFRTFCWCKRGEIVKTAFNSTLGEIITYSGRADCSPTNQSNFGLNIIIKNPDNYNLSNLQNLININPFTLTLKDILNNNALITDIYGLQLGRLVLLSIKKITEHLPNLLDDSIEIIGPTLEGVGYYPDINNNLQLSNNNIYCIGDCSGIFRGIVASMLSGYELGIRLTK
jgi:uncharacterized FAD-dependent dehydrogenase